VDLDVSMSVTDAHRMREALAALHDRVADYLNDCGMYPAKGSIARSEQEAWRGDSDDLFTAYSQGHLLLESASDHAYGLTRLLTEPIQTIAPWTCVRATLEAAAYACWLLTKEINATERVARSLAFRYMGLEQQLKTARCMSDHEFSADTLKRLDELQAEAISLGYKVILDKVGKRISVARLVPSATECIRSQLDGEVYYRICSSMVHSHVSALIGLAFSAPDSSLPNELSKNLSPHAACWLLLRATDAFSHAVWARATLFGHDLHELTIILDGAYDSMNLGEAPRFWKV